MAWATDIERNVETFLVPAETDDQMPRTKYIIKECPQKDKCSADAFKRAACWSYESEEKCKAYLAWHLNKSSLHYLPPTDATIEAAYAPVELEIESFEDREEWRTEDKAAKKRAQQQKEQRGRRQADQGQTHHVYLQLHSMIESLRFY